MEPTPARPRRLWPWVLVACIATVVVAIVAIRSFLARRPFQHGASVGAVDGGPELVRVADLERVPTDAGLVDASRDPSEDFLDGPTPGPSWAGRTRNLLIVGVDRRPWGRGGGLADTLIVAAMDRASGHVGLVSVPRDYYVELREGELGRINVALQVANQLGEDRGRYLAGIVGKLLDLRIHEVVMVDLTVLERAVDAVDGVDVVVPCPIIDDFVDPRTETGRRPLRIEAGTIHMDGVTAAMYARSRHGRSDWDRARRQQAVLFALRRRATSGEALSLVPRLLEELSEHVETDMTTAQMIELARYAVRVRPENLHGMVLASTNSEQFRTPEGHQVLVPLVDAIRVQIRDLFDAPAPGVDPRQKRCPEADVALRPRVHGPGAARGASAPEAAVDEAAEPIEPDVVEAP